MLIINSKVGDKILSSNTDSLLSQFCADFESAQAPVEQVNGKKPSKEKTDELTNEKEDTSSKSSPCVWKFYQDKKNDEFHKIGYRVQLTLQKVTDFDRKYRHFLIISLS